MAENTTYPASDPRRHTAHIKESLAALERHLRDDTREVTDARAKALFETTAEVLNGLETAYEHFETGAEEAWRGKGSAPSGDKEHARTKQR